MTQTVEDPNRRQWTTGRILTVTCVVALVLFWSGVFAYELATRNVDPASRNPDWVHDRAWVGRAMATCKTRDDAIAALPGAEATPDHVERARVVARATSILAASVARLAADRPASASDAKVIDLWLADYRDYITSRRDYARRLALDRTAKLLINERFNDPIDSVIGNFADVNNMPECEVPGDVA